MAAHISLLCSFTLIFALAHLLPSRPALAKRILVVPFANVSHTLIVEAVMRQLADRGHEVAVLWTNEFLMHTITRNPNYELIEFSMNVSREEAQSIQDAVQHEFLNEARRSMDTDRSLTAWVLNAHEQMRALFGCSSLVADAANKLCQRVLADGRLMKTLNERKFDIALVDDFFFSRCIYLFPHVLKVPYVSVGETSSWWNMRLPILPSALIGPEVNSVTFANRIAASLMILVRQAVDLLPSYLYYSEEVLRLANVSHAAYISLPSRSALFLYLWDDFMTGFTLPKMPHVEFIGGVTAGPAKSLDRGTETSRQLKAWADEAIEGFVVCSFGTVLVAPTEHMLEKLFDLFAALKLPVVFKLSSDHLTDPLKSRLPKNVLLLEWIPQNDLLGHPNARLFITHAGSNGYAEGLYHGVPLLAFPFIFPQRVMAERLEALGYGIQASLVTLTGAELATLGTKLLADKRYRERIQLVSRLIKARKHPAEAAADAVEHVLKYGSDHLRPHALYQLSFLQFYMLDVMFTLFTLTVVLVMVTFKCFKHLICFSLANCNKSRNKQHKKTKAD